MKTDNKTLGAHYIAELNTLVYLMTLIAVVLSMLYSRSFNV